MNARELRQLVGARLEESRRVQEALAAQSCGVLAEIARALIAVVEQGGSVYLLGNGGSAADAQHLAAELQGQLYLHGRPPLPVMALTTNSSTLTAIGNDLGFDQVFARQVEAMVRRDDAVVAISTSGRSRNVVAAARAARRRAARVIGFTGESGGALSRECHLCFRAPSTDVARIQECHITAGHIICELIEVALFGKFARPEAETPETKNKKVAAYSRKRR